MAKSPKPFTGLFEVEFRTEGKGGETVTLSAVPDRQVNAWLGVHPHGKISLSITEGDHSDRFKPGQRFELTLTPKAPSK